MSQTKTEGACMDGLDSDFKRRGRVKRYTMVIEPAARPEARRKLATARRAPATNNRLSGRGCRRGRQLPP